MFGRDKFKIANLRCSKCGSTDVKITSAKPNAGMIEKFLVALHDHANSCRGQRFIVCKECGHVGVMLVN